MKLSIVIPVYNVEPYIARTLETCVNQNVSTSDYEIIIVNDGTPDKSMDIINCLTYGMSNVRIVEQNNQGLSMARTNGMREAKGEYIWFVDSDDYIASTAVSDILKVLNGCDIITIGYEMYKNGVFTKRYIPKSVHSGTDLFGSYYPQGAVFYIYRKTFLLENNLHFMSGIFHEDFEFIPKVLFTARTVESIQKPLYYYLIRESSITKSFNSKRAFDLLVVAESLQNFKSSRITDLKSINEFNNLIGLAINNSLSIISKCNKTTKNRWLASFKNQELLRNSLCKCTVYKYKIEGKIFQYFKLVSPIFLYRLLQFVNFSKIKK